MFGRSFVGRKFTPPEGLDATADKNRSGEFHILVFRFGRKVCRGEECLWESGSVTTKVRAAVGFAQENKGRFVEELKALLRIPSISTDPERAGDVRRAAEFVAAELKRIGMENVQLIETSTAKHPGGHPLVYADWLHAEGRPTVLCYGH